MAADHRHTRGDTLGGKDLTSEDLERDGYQEITRLNELQVRAERFGARLRVQRRGQALGKQRYAYLVDLDPRGPHRHRSEEPQVAHDRLKDAKDHLIELENRYGES
jgi:hypothetical protein